MEADPRMHVSAGVYVVSLPPGRWACECWRTVPPIAAVGTERPPGTGVLEASGGDCAAPNNVWVLDALWRHFCSVAGISLRTEREDAVVEC